MGDNKMKYLSTNKIASLWGVSERTVRDYCNKGRVVGALLEGKTWRIPEDAKKPNRERRHFINQNNLLDILLREKETKLSGGIYHN